MHLKIKSLQFYKLKIYLLIVCYTLNYTIKLVVIFLRIICLSAIIVLRDLLDERFYRVTVNNTSL